MIKVLVVEDSAVLREFLVHILSTDPAIEVIGTAIDGEEAIKAVQRKQPDVITMDINMPRMDGFEATRRLMEAHPTPIVIVSGSWDTEEVATTFRAVEAGALAVLPRPLGIGHLQHEAMAQELIQTVKLMSEVKVVRRWTRANITNGIDRTQASGQATAPLPHSVAAEIKIVAIGASTGGPVVLQTILAALPKDFPIPVVIVQHMAAGFLPGFASWLAKTCDRPVQIAIHDERLLPGHVYLAPDGLLLTVEMGGRVSLTPGDAENGMCPSVSSLFRSVASTYGPNAAGVLLSGMGKDGAEELKLMKDRGAITIAQDKESSVVHGMPGAAIRQGGATYVLPPMEIAAALTKLVKPDS